jgi:uncharacterized membrane protein YkvA (DUF1232 family)
MAKSGEWAGRFVEWTEALPADVQATWALLSEPAIAVPGRRFLAGALSYALTQLDLIPDHERAGSVDDAFVLRLAYGLCAEHAAKVSTKVAQAIARMTNEEDEIRQFLDEKLFAKLRRYVADLADKEVRGRTTDHLLNDPRARDDMKRELDLATKKMKKAQADTLEEAEALEVSIKSYLKMKLGG